MYKSLNRSKQIVLDCQQSSQFFDNANVTKLANELKVTEVLNTFKDSKVPGNDGLPADFIKLSVLASLGRLSGSFVQCSF